MTVSEAFHEFLRERRLQGTYASQSLAKVQDCFNSWIGPRLGGLEIMRLVREDVLRLSEAMEQRRLSSNRRGSILAVLRSLLKFCSTKLRVQCLLPTEIALPRREQAAPEYLTGEEVDRIRSELDTARFLDLRLRALIELLLATGMRLGEALSMNRNVFDRGATESQIVGKGGKTRTVFFNQTCVFWIKQYLSRRWDSHPALFASSGPEPRRWATVDVSPFFIRLRKRAEISKKLTPHMLRHTFCTWLRDKGVDLSLIKELAGHADIDTTARYYLGVNKEALRTAVARLNSEARPIPLAS